MSRPIVIGSRGSQLALWQANYVADALQALGIETRIEIVKTSGDRLQSVSLPNAGGKGLFTKEIEEALLERHIDVAVHSLKDLPTQGPDGLTMAAVPEREDPRDALAGHLPLEARVGTSSVRRSSQLLLLRPDLQIEPVRGNVDTRLRKLHDGQYDAIVLAAAGLRRLSLDREISRLFTPEEICPAPGQGALAIQTRIDDPALSLCRTLNHAQTETAVVCERTVLSALGGGCQLPIAAFAQISGGRIQVQAGVFAPDGSEHYRAAGEGEDAVALGHRIAGDLIRRGAHGLLEQSSREAEPY